MRFSSVAVRASVAALVAISVGACAATPTSPSPRQTAPAASASGSATSSTDGIASPAPSTSAPPSSSASIPAGAQIDSRIQVGQPVAPRWFAADDRSIWVHEPTSLVRLDLATSAIAGQVPMDGMDYGYATTGEGAVWQTDFGRDAVLRIDPVAGKVVASIPRSDRHRKASP